jgi:DNA mismatch repair protein MutS2
VNAGRLLDAGTAHALGFAWLSETLAPVSDYGMRSYRALRPFEPGEEDAAQARAERIGNLAAGGDAASFENARGVLRAMPDIAPALSRAAIGETLDDPRFFELLGFCDSVDRVDAILSGIDGIRMLSNAGVRAVARALEPGRTRAAGFYLSDAFAELLQLERERTARSQAELETARGRWIARVAAALGRDDISSDEFIVMRSDLHAPLPEGVRVVREAPTYVLCALEFDQTTLAALARHTDAQDAAASAEDHVRTKLSAVVQMHAGELDDAARAVGELDVLIAAARYTLQYQCSVPQIVTHSELACAGARFAPLEIELQRQGRRFTPVDVDLHDTVVLTGPNMGGKSVCLQTFGLVAVCAAFGLPVPAREARCGVFRQIEWIGIGAGDDRLGGLLSSFAKEVVRLRDLFGSNARPLLVLIDEFARTTTPREGRALLVALIERLRESKACGIIATHFAGIARASGARHFAVRGLRGALKRSPAGDIQTALSLLADAMDYSIAPIGDDRERSSDAIELAAVLGLDDRFVETARRALDGE